jgi:hypothetical protein
LKQKLISIYYREKKARRSDKQIIKAMLGAFEKKYGQFMIFSVIIELVNVSKIEFCRKIINKVQKKII